MQRLEQLIKYDLIRPSLGLVMYSITPELPKSLTIIDLPQSRLQVHIHGSADDNCLFGSVKPYGSEKECIPLDSYQLAMADYYADQLNLSKIDK
ncbi:MAG: hypothetical protein V1725_08205 [archaeon]